VQRPPNGDDVELPESFRKCLRRTFDPLNSAASMARSLSRSPQHLRLWIDPRDSADERRKADRKEPWSGPEIDQALISG
jgi:hypothetical protein